ncbi:MAG: phospho-N-acetylmuramoyl-pentapeptide-transferase [Proteobacteria bacterium]|nr:phospho-N-acetylmuramoyl-pentapeptide-transferase [Pseudomonadota bacterium]NDC24136.1 phospho-N-acetylmuramoyl-pentapeptide-transferase [Pseudomonadota bacterium]
MLYHLLYSFRESFHALQVFRYITFRSLGAGLTSLLICLALGPRFIAMLKGKQYGQQIRDDGPQSHLKKSGTPTMGGILILLAVTVSTLLWSDLANPYIWVVLGSMLSFGFIGWLDDYKKIKEANSKGLSERAKMLLQTLFATVVIGVLFLVLGHDTHLNVPFFREFSPDLHFFYWVFAWLVIVGSSNAVNLTDGLDGLAIGPIMSTALTFGIFAYLAGNIKLAEYLYIPHVKDAGELSILCASIVCSGMGFLWFNTYPAMVFMGDVGALALGAALGTMAVITQNEIVLALVGGIFVLEATSVITQRISYKLTKKRVFRMAPIHHHFELSGWAEPQVTVRFWIISLVLAMLGLATLKLR